jgi:hypothetical protein
VSRSVASPSARPTSRLRRYLLLASALVAVGLGAQTASASAVATLPGFNNVKPVFEQNGFDPFLATYVHCYTNAQWAKFRGGDIGLMGRYDGGRWINVRKATCDNAAKLINDNQLSYTTATATATLMHETIHRQGIRDEATTECLADLMTGEVVKAWSGSATRAARAFAMARLWGQQHLLKRYRMSVDACIKLAGAQGIEPLGDGPAQPASTPSQAAGPSAVSTSPSTPTPAPTTTTPPAPTPTPVAPPVQPAPAQPAVVFDWTGTFDGSTLVPMQQINGARHIEVTYSVPPGATGGWWDCVNCNILDIGRGAAPLYAGTSVLKPGDTRTVTVDGVTGPESIVNFAVTMSSPWIPQMLPGMLGPMPLPVYPGPLTIHIVGYS